jgi:hypothetical protein
VSPELIQAHSGRAATQAGHWFDPSIAHPAQRLCGSPSSDEAADGETQEINLTEIHGGDTSDRVMRHFARSCSG